MLIKCQGLWLFLIVTLIVTHVKQIKMIYKVFISDTVPKVIMISVSTKNNLFELQSALSLADMLVTPQPHP